MTPEVTIDIFSGRPNPSYSLTPAEEAELARRVSAATPVRSGPHAGAGDPLGYRGILVDHWTGADLRLAIRAGEALSSDGRSYLDDGRELEKWLLSVAAGHGLGIAQNVLRTL